MVCAITGYVDRLGYLHCDACADARGKKDGTAVYADNAAYYKDCCDGCGDVFTKFGEVLAVDPVEAA